MALELFAFKRYVRYDLNDRLSELDKHILIQLTKTNIPLDETSDSFLSSFLLLSWKQSLLSSFIDNFIFYVNYMLVILDIAEVFPIHYNEPLLLRSDKETVCLI